MNQLTAHPIFAKLADHAVDLFVAVDDAELQRVIDREHNNSILGVRVVEVINNTLDEVKEVTGTLTGRVRAMVSDTEGCVIQKEFRDKIIFHPAYNLVVEELRDAHANGKLFDVFDSLEAIGVIAAYDKKTNKISLGLNAQKMSMGIREHKQMYSRGNQRAIALVNGEGGMLDMKQPKEDNEPVATMTTTFYLTFDV
mgnify:CR=1 FL=1